jgi:argininosuccinate lyase
MADLTLEDFKGLNPTFAEDVAQVFDFEASIEKRDAIGGTSKRMVQRQVDFLRKSLQ